MKFSMEVIGDATLCAWQPEPGKTRVQTRNPEYAKRLNRRADAVLVMEGVSGGFLRIYEFSHPLAWAKALIARYTSGEKYTNEANGDEVWP